VENSRVIFALDFDSVGKARPFIEQLGPLGIIFKVGLEAISRGIAHELVRLIHQAGGKVFWDGKFCDIPNTVGQSARAVADLGVAMFNVQASCGCASLKEAVANKGNSLVLAVTVLTSLSGADCGEIFNNGETSDVVRRLAFLSQRAGVDGLISSPLDLAATPPKDFDRKLIRVTPGIRPLWSKKNDQERVTTPADAIRLGADYLVIGRPIANPPAGIGSPLEAVQKILEEISISEKQEGKEK
jgi:orotidine-5'-phosphate decarboxylase